MPFNPDQPSYRRLRDHYAERRREIVFWVGAGASADAGLPVWPSLRTEIIKQALETASTMDSNQGKIVEQKLEFAKVENNLWDAFQSIKDAIGHSDFRESIRSVFNGASSLDVPDIYSMIWGLKNVSGMLSFNIDGFASRAHRRIRSEEEIIAATGKNISEYISSISNGRPFIADLHGQKDAPGSWIFTRNEIEALIHTPSYKQFIEYVFMARTVVFVGVSADDVASGGFLENLTAVGLDIGPHFWITDRRDADTHAWSQRSGVQLVRYQPEIGLGGKPNHSVVLAQIFLELNNYVSKDKKAPVVIPGTAAIDTIPSVPELRKRDDDEVRELLTAHAKSILAKNKNDTTSEEYKKFLKDYSPVIHQSWHITEEEPYNKFFGYTVVDRVSRSNFSNVWRIIDKNGNSSALKVIQIDSLHSGAQLDSFRRGVESLKFLSDSQVPGTPKLIEAREIPTSVVMSYIEGSNLAEIVARRDFDFWKDGLPIIINVCKHLRYSHNLPQGVLHRDVRPSNIMVPDFGWSELEAVDFEIDRYNAVLLNYDMSWHVNARGETISGKLEEAGFYAPELLQHGFGSVARRTYIDSYGVGMTLFFCFTKLPPPSAGSKSTDWESALNQKFRPNPRDKWRSATERLKRIIIDATNPDDEQRDTIDQISTKLKVLSNMVKGVNNELTSDVWAEELLNRVVVNPYHTDHNQQTFMRDLKVGRTLSIRGPFKRDYVELSYSNTATEHTDRAAGKLWGDKLRTAQDILIASGWSIEEGTTSRGREIKLAAKISLKALQVDMDKTVKNLNKAIDQIRLD